MCVCVCDGVRVRWYVCYEPCADAVACGHCQDIGGEYPQDRNPSNVLFQHNGIARIAYFKGEDRGGPLDMDLSAGADDDDDDDAYAFAPPSSAASRLVISLTNGYIVVFHNLDVSTPLKQAVHRTTHRSTRITIHLSCMCAVCACACAVRRSC